MKKVDKNLRQLFSQLTIAFSKLFDEGISTESGMVRYTPEFVENGEVYRREERVSRLLFWLP